MHDARVGETERLAGEALQTRAQRQVLALDLLHRQLPHRVPFGREMPLIDTGLVRVIPGDAKRRQQGAEFEERRILPGAHDVREHAPRAMIKRMPEPPRGRFGSDETLHFIEFGFAIWSDADGGA